MDVLSRVVTIPNGVTLSRIGVVLISLFFVQEDSIFLMLIIIAGLTDVLDGCFARILHQQSVFGAKLDSIADVFLFAVILLFVSCNYMTIVTQYGVIILLVALLKSIPIIIYYLRFHEIVIVHTILNKIMGVILFLLPFLIITSFFSYYILLVTLLALITIVEEIVIASKIKFVNREVKTILFITDVIVK